MRLLIINLFKLFYVNIINIAVFRGGMRRCHFRCVQVFKQACLKIYQTVFFKHTFINFNKDKTRLFLQNVLEYFSKWCFEIFFLVENQCFYYTLIVLNRLKTGNQKYFGTKIFFRLIIMPPKKWCGRTTYLLLQITPVHRADLIHNVITWETRIKFL